jgi:hypothetical protein
VNFDDFTRELCGALAHFQDGAQISKVSLPVDFSAVRINGFPDGTSPEAIRLLLSQLDISIARDCIRTSRQVSPNQVSANIKVEDPAFGETICSKFVLKENLGPEFSHLEVTQIPGSLLTSTNSSRVECKKVQCSWFKSF